MVQILDIVALRSLTSIADAGGFRKAADSLHLSQSAVSQHVRRLEQASGRVLVGRDGRNAHFTHDGELLVAQARKILAAHDDALTLLRDRADPEQALVIGATEHAADLLLPAVTARLQAEYPDSSIRYRIDRGRQLNDHLDEGTIDAALMIGAPRPRQGSGVHSAGALPLAWYAATGWQRPARDMTIPLVVIDSPCTIRSRAIKVLSDNGIAATVVCETGHLAGVLNAARAGLGVALLGRVGAAHEGLDERDDLPPLTPEPLHVRVRRGAPPVLAQVVGDAAEKVLASW